MEYTEDTKLENMQDVEKFCLHIVDEKLEYNAESGFSDNEKLDDEQKALLSRLVSEAAEIAKQESRSIEELIQQAKNVRLQMAHKRNREREQQIKIRQHRLRRTGFY